MAQLSPAIVDAINKFKDPLWRINNLYRINDKYGKSCIFKLNWAQEQLFRDMWYCNVVLKARQLGISTFICLLFLDRCLFNSNQSAGIIAHTLEDAQALFKRVKIAYDGLPDHLKARITCETDTAQMLKFSNGSSIRVGTSLRSSTFQYLHISEFGKICAKYPDKAQEIITGSLNTVAPGQYVFIESTAEGREGYFYDICKKAQNKRNQGLSKLDFKFHFFPWWGDETYRTGSVFPISPELTDYFEHLRTIGITLDDQQKHWYANKIETQSEDMKREYPSTPDEAWEQSTQGMYYGQYISNAYREKRIGHIPYDTALPVHTAWDLGFNDSTAIWFFQVYGKEIRLIDYIEGSGSLESYLGMVKKRDYVYGKHLGPHDLKVHEYSSGASRLTIARQMGINFMVVKKLSIVEGIDKARSILNRCWFDETKCSQGVKCLEHYRKEWDDRLGTWRQNPLHNEWSHGADAFRYLALGLEYVTGPDSYDVARDEANRQREWLRNRYDVGGRGF